MIKQLPPSFLPFFSLCKTHNYLLTFKTQTIFLSVKNFLIRASRINCLIFVTPLNLTVAPFLHILLFGWEIEKGEHSWSSDYMVISRIYSYSWKTSFNRVLDAWWGKESRSVASKCWRREGNGGEVLAELVGPQGRAAAQGVPDR